MDEGLDSLEQAEARSLPNSQEAERRVGLCTEHCALCCAHGRRVPVRANQLAPRRLLKMTLPTLHPAFYPPSP